jgi:hypothetical protein
MRDLISSLFLLMILSFSLALASCAPQVSQSEEPRPVKVKKIPGTMMASLGSHCRGVIDGVGL